MGHGSTVVAICLAAAGCTTSAVAPTRPQVRAAAPASEVAPPPPGRDCTGPLRFDSPRLAEVVRASSGVDDRPLVAADVEGIRSLWSKDLSVASLGGIECLVGLEALRFQSQTPVDLAPLASLARLRRLHLDEAVVKDAGPLASLGNLRKLRLRIEGDTRLAGLGDLDQLETLRLWITGPADLSPLGRLPKLWRLDLTVLGAIDLSPLATVQTIRRVSVVLRHRTDLSALANLVHLRRLSVVSRAPNLAIDVPDLGRLKKLKRLALILDQADVDLSSLKELEGLKRLTLHLDSDSTLELGFVAKLRRLKSVSIRSPAAIDIKALERAHPKIRFLHQPLNDSRALDPAPASP